MPYTHLTLEERIVIELFVHMGMSCREIAAYLGRSHTTVSRELRRNRSKSGYRSQTAERRARKRRNMPRHYRSMSRPELLAYVDEKLRSDWSPEQIAGRIRLDYPQDQTMRISVETIYRWIYAAAQVGDTSYRHLRRAHKRRRRQTRYGRGRRIFADFRREHPHLKVIVTEDGLSANAPHIKDLMDHDLRYILSAKPGDHAYMFSLVDAAAERGEVTELILPDEKKAGRTHCFRFLNAVPLNKVSQDELRVNFLEHWEVETRGEEVKVRNRFSWVTDLAITADNAMEIMRCGRARWRIENETFNTLKNQGYNLGHNYGLGKKHLSAVFMHLMLLAFLVDQVQQLCCPLFQAARAKVSSKRSLWERIRNYFHTFIAPSMERILRMIAHGFEGLQCPTYD